MFQEINIKKYNHLELEIYDDHQNYEAHIPQQRCNTNAYILETPIPWRDTMPMLICSRYMDTLNTYM